MNLFNTTLTGVSLTDVIKPTVPGLLGISAAGLIGKVLLEGGMLATQIGVGRSITEGKMDQETATDIMSAIGCLKQPTPVIMTHIVQRREAKKAAKAADAT